MKKKYLFVSVFLMIIGVKTANADCFSDYESADYAAKSVWHCLLLWIKKL